MRKKLTVFSCATYEDDLDLHINMLNSGLDRDQILSWFRSSLEDLAANVDCTAVICEAIKCGNRDVVKLLLEIVDVNITTIRPIDLFRRITPLSFAKRYELHYRDDPDAEEEWRTCKLILQDIKLHIIKLKAAGLYVSRKNLLAVKYKVDLLMNQGEEDSQALRLDRELYEHELECQKELETMKEERLGTKVSLYHALNTRDPKYTLNETLLHDLESVNLEEFPLYGILIKAKLKEDKWLAQILKKCSRYLGDLLEETRGVVLPDEVLEKILSYLEHNYLFLLECWSDGVETDHNIIDLKDYEMPIFSIQQFPL